MSIPYKNDKIIRVVLSFGKIKNYYYPHFIVICNGNSAKIANDRTIIDGLLPADILHYILDWAKENYEVLETKWNQLMVSEMKYRSAA